MKYTGLAGLLIVLATLAPALAPTGAHAGANGPAYRTVVGLLLQTGGGTRIRTPESGGSGVGGSTSTAGSGRAGGGGTPSGGATGGTPPVGGSAAGTSGGVRAC